MKTCTIYADIAQGPSQAATFFFKSQSALSAIDHSFLLEVETPPRIGLVASGLTNIITSSMSRRGGIASIFRKLWREAGVGCCDVIKRCEGNTGWESYACMGLCTWWKPTRVVAPIRRAGTDRKRESLRRTTLGCDQWSLMCLRDRWDSSKCWWVFFFRW